VVSEGPQPRSDDEQDELTSDPLRVLVADGDPIVRAALGDAIEGGHFAEVVEASDVSAAIDLVGRLSVDVVVAATDIPDGGGLVLVRRLRTAAQPVPVILLARAEVMEEAMLALRAGADGYLAKEIALTALPSAIRGVLAGEPAVSRRMVGSLVDQLRRGTGSSGGAGRHAALTNREWEVLDLLAAGLGTDAVAQRLFLSRETVRSHIKNASRKLGVSTRADAVARAGQLRGQADAA
jgi:DNA-binding NarL/FixJ family response regulator